MAEVERTAFELMEKPRIYGRFRDDIFCAVSGEIELQRLSETLKCCSVLDFTIERSQDRCLPYLDLLVEQTATRFKTKVYVKGTNVGRCMNARGECPDSYKRSVVAAYARRALTHFSTWEDVHLELERVRQMLTNNGFEGRMIEEVISGRLNKYIQNDKSDNKENHTITIYHKITFGSKYEQESDAIQKIVKRGVTPSEPYEQISLRIYTQQNSISSLIMKNNTAPRRDHAEETNVVYHFTCPAVACQRRKADYIGLTTATIRQRMQGHTYNGAIKDHYKRVHNRKPDINELITNTTVIHRIQAKQRLVIAEAVSIALKRPSLNIQREFDYILPSCRKRNVRAGENQAEEEREAQTSTEGTGDTEGTRIAVQAAAEEPPEVPQEPTHTAQEPSDSMRQRLRPRIRRNYL